MKDAEIVGTIDLTPSPAAYVEMLNMIIRQSSSWQDREWAASELVRIQPAVKAGHWSR